MVYFDLLNLIRSTVHKKNSQFFKNYLSYVFEEIKETCEKYADMITLGEIDLQ